MTKLSKQNQGDHGSCYDNGRTFEERTVKTVWPSTMNKTRIPYSNYKSNIITMCRKIKTRKLTAVFTLIAMNKTILADKSTKLQASDRQIWSCLLLINNV